MFVCGERLFVAGGWSDPHEISATLSVVALSHLALHRICYTEAHWNAGHRVGYKSLPIQEIPSNMIGPAIPLYNKPILMCITISHSHFVA